MNHGTGAEQELHAVIESLRAFHPIRNQVLQWVVSVLPLGIIAFVLIDALVTRRYVTDNPMFLTGLLTAALAAFLFQMLMDQVPETLHTLWTRAVLKPVSETAAVQGRLIRLLNRMFSRFTRSHRQHRVKLETDGEIGACYRAFIAHFADDLNHRASWALGLFFAVIMYVSFSFRMELGWNPNWMGQMLSRYGRLPLLGSLAQVATAYVLGLLVWRMLVIAWKVYRVGQVFDFSIQVQHPDRSGGLKPLGDLCLSNALIITVPSIFLAGWIIVIITPQLGFGRYLEWVAFYRGLLLVMSLLAFLAFFQPLYGVHRGMVRQRHQIRCQLDKLSRQLDELAQRLLKEAELLTVDQREQLQKDLNLLRQVYDSNSYIPVWLSAIL